MVKLNTIFICDDFDEGGFDNYNFTGCNLSDSVGISPIPYNLTTTVVILGEYDSEDKSQELNISIKLYDLNDEPQIIKDLNEPITITKPVEFKPIPLTILWPVELILDVYTKIEICAQIGNVGISRQYKIIDRPAPSTLGLFHGRNSQIISGNNHPDIELFLRISNRKLVVIDGYLDVETIANLYSKLPPGAKIQALVNEKTMRRMKEKSQELKSLFTICGSNLEIKATNQFHDRFLIVNDSMYFHFGHSIKDMVNGKVSRYSKLVTAHEIEELKRNFSEAWASAIPLGQPH